MKQFLIHCDTYWCGEQNTFSAYANDESEIEGIAQMQAYDNFSDFSGFQGVLEDLFPDEEEYTDEMENIAMEHENEYYSYWIEEFDPESDDNFEWYDLIYDGREIKN